MASGGWGRGRPSGALGAGVGPWGRWQGRQLHLGQLRASCASLVPSDTSPLLQQIMKDKWINIGYEGEELKPYTEPEEDFGDTKRIGEGHRARGGASQHLVPLVSACRGLPGHQ